MMQREVESGRTSVWYDLRKAAQTDASIRRVLSRSSLMYPHMLVEDVELRAFPYRGYGDREIEIKVTPEDEKVEDSIAFALGQKHSLSDAVAAFGRQCLANIILFGSDAYEIVYQQAPRQGQEDPRFSFVRIPPCSLVLKSGRAFQRVPRQLAKEMGVPVKIDLPLDRLVVFGPPLRLRGHLSRILERLAALSGDAVPQFAMENMRPDAKRRVPFDIKQFSRTKDLAIANAAREIGWTGRAIFGFGEPRVVEHYWWYRELAFERFLIELRDGYLIRLNDGISRIGARCGFESRIIIAGLPTLDDVDEAQCHLLAGDRSLTEINSAFKRN